jgi:DNA-binding MarR family transcriptional regulator
MRRESAPDLTLTLHAALRTVETHGPMTPGQLAAHENVRKPTMTRTIQTLVDRDLVVRTPDPEDGRVSWLQITPGGRRLLQHGRRRTDLYLSRALRRLSHDDRETLLAAADVLERIAEMDLGDDE